MLPGAYVIEALDTCWSYTFLAKSRSQLKRYAETGTSCGMKRQTLPVGCAFDNCFQGQSASRCECTQQHTYCCLADSTNPGSPRQTNVLTPVHPGALLPTPNSSQVGKHCT